MRDLRVSVTSRCNFRCLYCLPDTEESEEFLRRHLNPVGPGAAPDPAVHVPKPSARILTFEEIERVVRLAVGLGINKLRVTGGEPLLRHGLEELISRLARIPGVTDLAMTTNGFLFPQKAEALRQAGLKRVSFSLDSLDADNFKRITGRDGLGQILAGITRAQEVGLNPVKVNAVIIRGLNEQEVEPLTEFARRRGLHVRFIEFMPLDSGRHWSRQQVVSGQEILQRLQARFRLRPVTPASPSETSRRWAFADGSGEIGIIAPVTEPFCGHCNGLRLTADGKVRTCLFSVEEHDLLDLVRDSATDEALSERLRAIVQRKEDRHHIGEAGFIQPARTMSCIGG